MAGISPFPFLGQRLWAFDLPLIGRVEGGFVTIGSPSRHLRQNVVLFVIASLVGVWLGAPRRGGRPR
jgi:hypothetical protein